MDAGQRGAAYDSEKCAAASLAPWEDADNPVESTLESTILASGT